MGLGNRRCQPADGRHGWPGGWHHGQGRSQAGYNKGALKVEVLATPGLDPGESDRGPNRDLWFGDFRAGNINGFKYEDLDQNGKYNPAIDVPMKGVTMCSTARTAKASRDPEHEDGRRRHVLVRSSSRAMPTATSSTSRPRRIPIATARRTPDAGIGPGSDRSQGRVVQRSDAVNLDKNLFGNFIRGSIHGFKFHDKDGDGIRMSEEPL